MKLTNIFANIYIYIYTYTYIHIHIVQVKVETIPVVQCSTRREPITIHIYIPTHIYIYITIHMRLGVTLCTSWFTVLFCKANYTHETWCHTLYILFYSAVL